MAQYNNNQSKTYATDEAGMLKDAKQYAKRDFSIVELTLKKLDIEYDKETVANALIQVKLDQIKHARLERNTFFD